MKLANIQGRLKYDNYLFIFNDFPDTKRLVIEIFSNESVSDIKKISMKVTMTLHNILIQSLIRKYTDNIFLENQLTKLIGWAPAE